MVKIALYEPIMTSVRFVGTMLYYSLKPFFLSFTHKHFLKTDIDHPFCKYSSFISPDAACTFDKNSFAMHTVDILTTRCTALHSDIQFLKKEIGFLLKILGNCYSSSIHAEQLKLQDGYWKHFEEQQHELDVLDATVQKEESKLIDLYLEGLIHEETVRDKQGKLQAAFDTCYSELKSLKESFYTFMNGCNACALKTAC